MKGTEGGGKKSKGDGSPRLRLIGRRGWRFIAAGAVLAASGLGTLLLIDPAGTNWASIVSPAAILIGYVLIGIGTVMTDAPAASRPYPPA